MANNILSDSSFKKYLVSEIKGLILWFTFHIIANKQLSFVTIHDKDQNRLNAQVSIDSFTVNTD